MNGDAFSTEEVGDRIGVQGVTGRWKAQRSRVGERLVVKRSGTSVTKSHAFHQFSVRRRTFWQLVVLAAPLRDRPCACVRVAWLVCVCVCGHNRTTRTARERLLRNVDVSVSILRPVLFLCRSLSNPSAVLRKIDRSEGSDRTRAASAIFVISAREAQWGPPVLVEWFARPTPAAAPLDSTNTSTPAGIVVKFSPSDIGRAVFLHFLFYKNTAIYECTIC